MSNITPHNPSKNAIERVLNPLPPITCCHYCGSQVSIEQNKEIYGRNYGDYPWIYLCDSPACKAYVGIHPDTNIPLGTLADAKTRKARKEAKDVFTAWYKTIRIDRGRAYQLLANALKLPKEECHFGWFDVDACEAAKKAVWELKSRGLK